MSATVSISRSKDVTVLKLTGKTSLAEGAALLQHTLSDCVWAGYGRFLVDLSNVEGADSAGVLSLVTASRAVGKSGGQLVFASLNQRIQALLRLTKLDQVFTVFDTAASALRHFDQTRNPTLHVAVRYHPTYTILQLSGSLTHDGNARELSRAVRSLPEQRRSRVIALFPQVLDIDVVGAAEIGSNARFISAGGGELVLAGIEPSIKARLREYDILNQVRCFDQLDYALQGLRTAIQQRTA
jgi:anti-sigma B factor antagonist